MATVQTISTACLEAIEANLTEVTRQRDRLLEKGRALLAALGGTRSHLAIADFQAAIADAEPLTCREALDASSAAGRHAWDNVKDPEAKMWEIRGSKT